MTCENAKERWGEYAAGTLPEAERSALGAHAASCAECRRERDAYVRLEAMLQARLARPAARASIAGAVVARVRNSRRPGNLRWGVAAAAASLLVSAVAIWFSDRSSQPTRLEVATTRPGPTSPVLHESCRERALPAKPPSLASARTTETVLPPVPRPVPTRLVVACDSPTRGPAMSAAHPARGSVTSLKSESSLIVVVVE